MYRLLVGRTGRTGDWDSAISSIDMPAAAVINLFLSSEF